MYYVSVCLYICLQLSASISGVKEVIVKKQRDLNRVMMPVVRRHMVAGYKACNLEQGHGMYERMKCHVSRHVDIKKSVMFRDASVTLLDQLSQLQVHVNCHQSLVPFPHCNDQTQRSRVPTFCFDWNVGQVHLFRRSYPGLTF